MVQHHLEHSIRAVPAQPKGCPQCGSHRAEIVGRSESGTIVALRCNHCGTRSQVANADVHAGALDDVTAELEAIVAVGRTLTRLQNADARRRVLNWAFERFAADIPLPGVAGTALPTADQTLIVDGLADLFEPRRRADLRLVVVNDDLADLFDGAERPDAVDDRHYEPAESWDGPDTRPLHDGPADSSPEPELDVLVADFVSDFRRLANEWQNH
jgi:hypothetical protein